MTGGQKILEGLKDAVAGNFSAVTIEGQRWVRAPAWQPIDSAPKDGTKVDLLFAYPRGRTNDCEWRQGDVYGDGGWYWSRPTWKDFELLPESEWDTNRYPNMEPTHWMLPPRPPEVRP